VLESWQSDTLNPEVMPKLWRFAGSATRFDQHVSSGSSTVPGLFGLMFGLHPSYFGIFKTSPNSNPSVFTEALVAQGYRSRVFTSSALERFALRTMLFSRVDEADYYSVNSDQRVLDHYLETLADPARGPEPGFDFVFFTSSHSSYNYPPEYARFRPLPAVEGGYALNKMADAGPYLNDYYNSLHYIDALLGQLFEALERSGRLEDTWVIVTGDHAEEFNQNGLGYWGHGSNFTRWQIQTPLVLRVPGQREGRVETGLSLHQDVVPTLMKRVLGCDADFADYANGADLFDLPARRGTVLSSYFANAYLVDGGVFELSTGREYAWDDMRQSRRLDDPAIIRELMEQRSRFLDRK
jgi:membrane-anchored protein YejM (alkaline phosphatase superfamily)